MTDLDLFAFGCAVTFLVLAGVYVYAREHFPDDSLEPEPIPGPVRSEMGKRNTSP